MCIYFISCTSHENPCLKVKEGRFYYYSPGHEAHMIIVRGDSVQFEINMKTGDTSYWKIKWTADCQFSTHYLSGLKFTSKEEEYFYTTSTVTFTIGTITKDYFIYDGLFENSFMHKNTAILAGCAKSELQMCLPG